MDAELRERVEHEAEAHALYNALLHEGEANAGTVIGRLMAEYPGFRDYNDEIPPIVGSIIGHVNSMDQSAQRDRLKTLSPDLFEDLTTESTETEAHPLPDLPNADSYDTIRMRVAPNPNGPWHIGHARMPAVVGTYSEQYDGWFACRFDDTDPETKRPDLGAYDQIISDLEFLGFEPDMVLKASDRLETYYEYGSELIEHNAAYACSCPAAEFSELKAAGEPCPHRDQGIDRAHETFDEMISGEYSAGEMVLRVRTNIKHKNPAVRDWVAFRIVDTPHPRNSVSSYRCWPMLDFQSGIDDYLLDITHIVRGIDLQDSAKRQQFVYSVFGWDYPEVFHWGHVQIDEYEVRLSTSVIRERIERGDFEGWDDPRVPTIMSLRRRGIQGSAIVDAMIELGTSKRNVELAMSSVYSKNRELIDDTADRLFFVRNGIEKQIVGGPDEGCPPVHPEFPERGKRKLPVTGGVMVEPNDIPITGDRVWLKGYGCVRHVRDAFEYTGATIEVVREENVPVIHWVPSEQKKSMCLRTMDGDVNGHTEKRIADYVSDDLVQFERVGYARIDSHHATETTAYFAHH